MNEEVRSGKGNLYDPSACDFSNVDLPRINELLNVVVVEGGSLADEEVLRVLVPGGIALVRDDGRWRKIEKEWPADIGRAELPVVRRMGIYSRSLGFSCPIRRVRGKYL